MSSNSTKIRLADWARRNGVHPKTALRWVYRGAVSGAEKSPSGRWYVWIAPEVGTRVVLYGRVSSSDQSEDLVRQMERLRAFAASRGLVVSDEVSEIGSGLNGHRKKLVRLLSESRVGTIIVEHRDRLARFGVEYIEAALSAQGRQILVANEGEQNLDLIQDFVDVVTSFCARIYGRRAAHNRARRAVEAAEGGGQ